MFALDKVDNLDEDGLISDIEEEDTQRMNEDITEIKRRDAKHLVHEDYSEVEGIRGELWICY